MIHLSDEERVLFDDASLENLFYESSVLNQQSNASSPLRKASEKLRPLVSEMRSYGQAMDIYANACPIILSPLWGSVRVLLRIAIDFEDYFDKLLEMFTHIGDVLPRLRHYQVLFSSHRSLVLALSAAYLDVIGFCTRAKRVFRKGKRKSKPWSGSGFKLIWKPFKLEFTNMMVDFRRHAKEVEKQAGLADMVEAAESRSLARVQWEETLMRRKDEHRQRLLKYLSSFDYTYRHRKLCEVRHEGSGAWLFKNEQFKDWKEGRKSSCLLCSGIPGCGKSVLASLLVESCLSQPQKGVGVAYYYCDYSLDSSLRASAMLGALIKQLLPVDNIPAEVEEKLEQFFRHGTRLPTDKEFSLLLSMVMKRLTRVFLIIDGLEECGEAEQSVVVPLVHKLAYSDDPVVKLFLTIREDVDLNRALQKYPRIAMSEEKLGSDISSFVQHKITSELEAGNLVIGDDRLEGEIISALSDGARGSFLWVTFQLAELCDAFTDHDIRETLKNLPVDLGETYGRILKRILRSKGNPAKSTSVRRIFKWMVCAKRPLHIDELREAVAFEPAHSSWDADRIPRDGPRLVQSCGGLVNMDRSDYTTRFAHYTVQQYLLADAPSDLDSAGFHFTSQEADLAAGEVCLTYLSFSDFETQLARTAPKVQASDAPVLEHVISQLPYGRPILDACRFMSILGPRDRRPALDFTRHARKTETPSQVMMEKYRLLGYVLENWIWHTKVLQDGDRTWPRFKRLALEERTTFKAGLWKEVPATSTLPHLALFRWAAANGHLPLMRAVKEASGQEGLHPYFVHEGTEPNVSPIMTAGLNDHFDMVRELIEELDLMGSSKVIARQASGLWPSDLPGCQRLLSVAIQRKHVEMFRLLFATGIRPEPTEPGVNPLLLEAVEIENLEIVSMLLDEGAATDVYSVQDLESSTPLYRAIELRNVEIVRMLLAAGASTAVSDDLSQLGQTPLILAARIASTEILELLLSSGADVHFVANFDTRTALQAAARRGNVEVMKLLLAAGAKDEAEPADTEGRTALQGAAEGGYKDAIRLLLDAGSRVNAEPARKRGLTALQAAAAGGHDDIVDMLLAAGAKVNSEPARSQGFTALQAAAAGGHELTVCKLLAVGADVNADSGELTAVGWAAMRGHTSSLIKLLAARADVNIAGSDPPRHTPLEVAIEFGKPTDVALLLDAGAHVNPIHDDRERWFTPLQIAASLGDVLMVRKLILKGADVNASISNNAGKTALQAAAGNGHLEIVELLLPLRPNINAPPASASGRTALQAAAENGHKGMVSKLLELGANVGAEPAKNQGLTALQAAAKGGHLDIAMKLLSAGASVHDLAGTVLGRTALQAAAENGQLEMVKLLLQHGASVSEPEASTWGMSALEAAEKGGHDEVAATLKAALRTERPSRLMSGRNARSQRLSPANSVSRDHAHRDSGDDFERPRDV
ncbi:MAG: hypothetical protein M1832_000246 [Thelocarpon impressellum]|nr:MAG: hypothetical protein M1832_000246 [Thelocarpon impressellum]